MHRSLVKRKYKLFALNYFIGLALILIGLSSCSTSSQSVVIPLSPMNVKDARFVDTISESTVFYFGLFNFDGYDRFGGNIFDDLRYRLSSRISIEQPDKEIDYYEGNVDRKGVHLEYTVKGLFINEPPLSKKKMDEGKAIANALVNELPKPLKSKVPEGISVILEAKSSGQKTEEAKPIELPKQPQPESEEKLDDRLIIIACFREDYFEENMLDLYRNDLSDIDHYKANGWVRIYLTDFPGYRIWEAKEVFPDAWRAYYGE